MAPSRDRKAAALGVHGVSFLKISEVSKPSSVLHHAVHPGTVGIAPDLLGSIHYVHFTSFNMGLDGITLPVLHSCKTQPRAEAVRVCFLLALARPNLKL